MSQSNTSWPPMPQEIQHALRSYLIRLRTQVGPNIEAVILYGSLARGEYVEGRSNINLLLILKECSLEILQRCGYLHRRWGKEGIVAPLLMTKGGLQHSLELFPLEYFEIKDQHVLLEGRDPFPSIHINDRNLGVQCEQEIIGNLLRVRQRFIEGWGRSEAIQALLPISLTALIPCLRGLLRLLGHASNGDATAILDRLPDTIQFEPTVLQEVLNMKRGLSSPGTNQLPHLYERYHQTLQDLIARVQKLKVEGRLA